MKPIKIAVTGAEASVTEKPALTSGTVGLPVEFTFDDAWNGLDKTAVFRAGSRSYPVSCVQDAAIVPWEVLERPGVGLYIGVVGADRRGIVKIPTVWVLVDTIAPGTGVPDTVAQEPTPQVYDQILAAANQAVDVANSVREDADNGVFNGEKGDKGEKGETKHIDSVDVFENSKELDNHLLAVISRLKDTEQERVLMVTNYEEAAKPIPDGNWTVDITRYRKEYEIFATAGGNVAGRRFIENAFIENASFEQIRGIAGWELQQNHEDNVFVDSTARHSGYFSLHLLGGGVRATSEPIAVTAGKAYVASCYAMGDNTATASYGQIYLIFLDECGNEVTLPSGTVKFANIQTTGYGEWNQGTVTIVAPDNATHCAVRVSHTAASSGNLWIDDVVFKENGTTENLLVNGGFEQYTEITGWTPSKNTVEYRSRFIVSPEKVKDGNGRFALKIVDTNPAGGYSILSDAIAVTAGNEYAVSCDASGQGPMLFGLQFFDKAGTLLEKEQTIIGTTADEWTHGVCRKIAPANAESCKIYLQTSKGAADGGYFDNIDFAENPAAEWTGTECTADRFTDWAVFNLSNGTNIADRLQQLEQKVEKLLTN